MKKVILTGDRPSGNLHLGHYIGSLQNRLFLQQEYEQYIMIADVQALTDNFTNPQKIISSVYEVCADYLSIGIDPNKSTIFIQSQIPEITELTIYYLNLVSLSRLERNPTVKTEIKQKQFTSIPVGFLCYPISQAADISIFKADLVPAGNDQAPMIEQTNEIIRKFNTLYNTSCLQECSIYLSSTPRLIGIDGKAKASKSLNNTILLKDPPTEVEHKVMQMFTDPNHIRINDPGKIEGNVVFAYLDAFYPNQEEIVALKQHYTKGGLGDTTIKKLLITTLNTLLAPFHEKRNNLRKDDIAHVLQQGTIQAQRKAQLTMNAVRQAIGFTYFNSV